MINIKKQKQKHFCKDDYSLIENYEQAINDKTQYWDLHHRLELTLDGEYAHNVEDLIRMGMYYDRPYFELIYLPHSEHASLHDNAMNPDRLEQFKQVNVGRKRPDLALRNKEHSPNLNKIKSEFGQKYFEHFGIHRMDDIKQYQTEWQFWKTHNKKYRWEI
jgi:hypothetical protein